MDTVGSSLVSTGTNVVTTTGTVVGSGVDLLVGRPVTHADMVVYRKHGVIYRNGHSYAIQNGRYIIVR
ncbi:hypothetical protein [Legionella beliardensis]|nr:hypothetical protein [Legionella beliardensis]